MSSLYREGWFIIIFRIIFYSTKNISYKCFAHRVKCEYQNMCVMKVALVRYVDVIVTEWYTQSSDM